MMMAKTTTKQDFMNWLDGFFAGLGSKALTATDIQTIKERANMISEPLSYTITYPQVSPHTMIGNPTNPYTIPVAPYNEQTRVWFGDCESVGDTGRHEELSHNGIKEAFSQVHKGTD